MKQNFIQRFFSKMVAKQLRKPSGLLASKVGNEMNRSNSELYDLTIDAMQLTNNESVLEIGFGNGKFFDKLFSVADNLQISGLDFSEEMVKAATVNNPSTSNSGALTLTFGSSDKIPFADNSFDKVFCINVIYFWEQPAAHLKEIYRVLKPGGKFYTTIRSKESMAEMPFTKYGFNIYSQDEWMNILELNHLHFVHSQKTKNEPGAVFNKQLFQVQALCIVVQKKYNTLNIPI
jgi:ubiquinone/menaquinone biosynthesis C-methylase UbiE